MAASKKKIVETFTKVSGIGEAYAEQLYDELGLRSLEDLVKGAEDGKLQALKGVGPAKEKSILKSAKDLLSTSPKTESPAKKESKSKAKKGSKKSSKKADTKKADAKKADAKKDKKTGAKKSGAKKSAKKADKPAPEASAKKDEPKSAPKKDEPKKETPKRAPRSTASDFESRARSSSGSEGKRPTIPGLLFKIGKKLVSRLLS